MYKNVTVKLSYFLALVLLLSACSGKAQIPQNSIIVEFKNNAYNPKNINIKTNQTITFVNQSDQDIWPASNIHPTHQIYPEFDPKKPLGAGGSWSFTFEKPGIWKFHDHLQPQITGEISVQ